MKVKELISVLNKLDPNKEVFTNIYQESYYVDGECIEYKEPADQAWLDENGDLCIGITVSGDDGKQMLI